MGTALQDRVVTILHSPAVRAINFTIDYLTYDAAGFEQVAQAIRRGKITIDTEPQPGTRGNYSPYTNRLFLDPTLPPDHLDITVVHEVAHAIQDAKGLPMRFDAMEAGAMIAQIVFEGRRYLGSTRGAGGASGVTASADARRRAQRTPEETDLVSTLAWVLRRCPELLQGRHVWVDLEVGDRLKRAVVAQPYYAKAAYEMVMLDGIG